MLAPLTGCHIMIWGTMYALGHFKEKVSVKKMLSLPAQGFQHGFGLRFKGGLHAPRRHRLSYLASDRARRGVSAWPAFGSSPPPRPYDLTPDCHPLHPNQCQYGGDQQENGGPLKYAAGTM